MARSSAAGALATVLLAAVIALLAIVVVRVASHSDAFLLENGVLDDAAYFAKLARSFVEGHGYALDGRNVTNGVQPLWAGVVIALAAVFRDDGNLLRAMIVTGGLAWLTGALLLGGLLRRHGALASLVGGAGMAIAGIQSRLAITGMENGIHGLLVVLALRAAIACAACERGAPAGVRRWLWLGVTAGAMALNRVEYALLCALLVGWAVLHARAVGSTTLRQAGWAVLPPTAFAIAWCALSYWGTGALVPISGTVKAWVDTQAEQRSGGTDGGAWSRFLEIGETFLQHAVQAQILSCVAWALVLGVPLAVVLGVLRGSLVAAALGVGSSAARTHRGGGVESALWHATLVLAGFLVLHTALWSRFLFHHKVYCSWHSPGEVVGIWLLLGLAVSGLSRGILRPLAWALAAVALQPLAWFVPQWWHPGLDPQLQLVAPLSHIGQWLQRHLPAGQRIGAFNGGLIALVADRHAVTNLDGLVNTPQFFRDYYSQQRIAAYLRDQGIGYVADHAFVASLDALRELQSDLVPLLHRPTGPDSFACVLAVAAGVPLPRHPLAALLFRAQVHREFAIVPPGAALPADRQVVASYAIAPSPALFHVVAGAERFAGLAPLDADSAVARRDLRFACGIAVEAVDLPEEPILAGTLAQLAVFVRCERAIPGGVELVWQIGGDGHLAAPASANVVPWREPFLHGSLGAGRTAPAGLTAHCTACVVPPELRGAALPVWLGVRAGDGPPEVVQLGTVAVAF